jgi:hypothetical protein
MVFTLLQGENFPLKHDQVRGLYAAGDAAEVDDERGAGDEFVIVELRMCGDDRRERGVQVDGAEAELGQRRDVGVVVGDFASSEHLLCGPSSLATFLR